MPLSKLLPFEPPRWAPDGHSQTIWGHLLPSPRLQTRGESLTLALSDGDRLALTFFRGDSDLVVYLFHGLGGDTSADYMERTARVAIDLGHSVYLVNHRGCGAGLGLAKGPYHSGRGEDVSRAIELGRERHPSRRHLAVGFSLGGNALLCLLTGLRGTVLPDCAISVNAPIDLAAAAIRLQTGFSRVYDLRFVKHLRGHVKQRQRLGLLGNGYAFKPFGTLRDFDAVYTAPAGGFRDRDEYYSTCSTYPHLAKISVPTIMLTTEDDPIVPSEAYKEAKLSGTTTLHIEKYGGHMGFLARRKTPLGTYRWLDYALREAIRALAE